MDSEGSGSRCPNTPLVFKERLFHAWIVPCFPFSHNFSANFRPNGGSIHFPFDCRPFSTHLPNDFSGACGRFSIGTAIGRRFDWFDALPSASSFSPHRAFFLFPASAFPTSVPRPCRSILRSFQPPPPRCHRLPSPDSFFKPPIHAGRLLQAFQVGVVFAARTSPRVPPPPLGKFSQSAPILFCPHPVSNCPARWKADSRPWPLLLFFSLLPFPKE